ncbi:Adenylate cyclase type 2 [Orchesella cincta]|uniref:adenylate cyclase n=1 Tax=Orchesella cincta TaxID=48709 RepID=A0A1D2NAG2_ORCCI|nr:Adenylate cyclase type 2 [Orchesella cincta]
MVRLQNINTETGLNFQLRVGVSAGLVVAGVVGTQKPLYDIWGDTVNLASRMDSHGSPNKIQVSAYCANLLSQAHVRCEQRGNIFVKGKGNMVTFYVMLDNDFRIMYDYDDFVESEAEYHCTDL